MAIVDRFHMVQERIKAALLRAHRPEDSARCIVVTKHQPLTVLEELYAAGIREMGESRVSEALLKMEQLPSDISWHLIGSLQSNKAAKAASRFSCLHSVDSIDLAKKLSECGKRLSSSISIFVQVNPLGEKTKHGFLCEELEESVAQIISLPHLCVCGLMAMAPKLEYGEAAVHQAFERVQTSFLSLRGKLPGCTELSMGMSDDFEIALQYGATIVRIGSLICRE